MGRRGGVRCLRQSLTDEADQIGPEKALAVVKRFEVDGLTIVGGLRDHFPTTLFRTATSPVAWLLAIVTYSAWHLRRGAVPYRGAGGVGGDPVN